MNIQHSIVSRPSICCIVCVWLLFDESTSKTNMIWSPNLNCQHYTLELNCHLMVVLIHLNVYDEDGERIHLPLCERKGVGKLNKTKKNSLYFFLQQNRVSGASHSIIDSQSFITKRMFFGIAHVCACFTASQT